jgi:hypothetical protein
MKHLTRRQFAKLAGGAALVPAAAVVASAEWRVTSGAKGRPPDAVGINSDAPLQSPATQQSSAAAPVAEPRVKLTPEQETRVKQAIERRERQLAAMRARVLPYDAEPAFVFRVRKSGN